MEETREQLRLKLQTTTSDLDSLDSDVDRIKRENTELEQMIKKLQTENDEKDKKDARQDRARDRADRRDRIRKVGQNNIYRVFIVFYPKNSRKFATAFPRQHSAALVCIKNYQPIGVTVHSHCVESFEDLLQRCRRGRGCSEL